jgi:glycosyltransferase involved in cell wall biosynthesis
MRMIKVLVVAQTPPPYLGAPIMIGHLVNSRPQGVKIIHLPMRLSNDGSAVGIFRWSKLIRLFPTIVRIVHARIVHKPNILYYAPAGSNPLTMFRDFAVLLTTRFLFPKTVFHFHGSGISDLYKRLPRWQQWLFRMTYFHVDGAIRLSDLTPEDAKGLKARREYIVPNGIEDPCPDLCLPKPTVQISANRPLRVLFVAILRESKGLLVLLEACAQLVARGVPVECEVMGKFESPKFETRVRDLVASLSLGERVRFLGELIGQEKQAAFSRADVFSMPTFYDCEAFPLVLLESMANGLPIVATRWRGIPSMVDDGETGFLVEPHDVTAVADRLARLAGDAELRAQMGMAGRERFVRDYTLPVHIERMRRVFLDVTGEEAFVEEQPRREVAELTVHGV